MRCSNRLRMCQTINGLKISGQTVVSNSVLGPRRDEHGAEADVAGAQAVFLWLAGGWSVAEAVVRGAEE